jgi:molecular chaperone GrpE
VPKEKKEHKPCITCQTAIDTVREEETDKYIRLVAEFENYKKRVERDITTHKKFATEEIIKEILPTIDNMEAIIKSSGDEGMELILKSLLKVLEKRGIVQTITVGQPFDPNFHESIGRQEDDRYEKDTVVVECRKGYTMEGRLLRPAVVLIVE